MRKSFLFLPLVLLLTACSTTVGPVAKQDRTGQTLSNSPLNQVTLTDDQGTSTSSVAGPTDWIKQDSGSTISHTTGQVTRTIAAERPDGTRFTLRSGSDFEASGVKFDPNTGAVSVDHFSTSSSAPLVALAGLQEKAGEVVKSLSADQADVLKTISQNQKDTILGIAKQVSPEFLSALKTLLGG